MNRYTSNIIKICLALLFIFYLVPRIQYTFERFKRNAVPFLLLRGNHDALKKMSRLFIKGHEAKQVIPSGNKVRISTPMIENDFRFIYLRYILYPTIVDNEDWAYLIDINKEMRSLPKGWKVFRLSGLTNVFAKPGYELNRLTRQRTAPLKGLIGIFIVVAGRS